MFSVFVWTQLHIDVSAVLRQTRSSLSLMLTYFVALQKHQHAMLIVPVYWSQGVSLYKNMQVKPNKLHRDKTQT